MPRGPRKWAVVFTAFHSPEPFANSLTKQGGAFLLLKEKSRMMCFSVSLSTTGSGLPLGVCETLSSPSITRISAGDNQRERQIALPEYRLQSAPVAQWIRQSTGSKLKPTHLSPETRGRARKVRGGHRLHPLLAQACWAPPPLPSKLSHPTPGTKVNM